MIPILFMIYKKGKIYSTEETKVGTWIDGKPIYRKVVVYSPSEVIGANGTQTNVEILHNINNFKMCIDAKCVDNSGYIFPCFAGSNSSVISATGILRVDNTNIHFRIVNNTWGNRIFYFILEYTKTTD